MFPRRRESIPFPRNAVTPLSPSAALVIHLCTNHPQGGPHVPLATGDKAPDFTLTDTDGQDVSLSSFQGRQNVLLVFYCRNNTPG